MVSTTTSPERVSTKLPYLVMRDGLCANPKCRRPTKVFLGSIYCADCIERLGGAMERRWQRDELIARAESGGYIHEGTLRCRFDRSNPEFEESLVYAQAKSWTPGSTNVYMAGTIGCGKTYLARCMLNASLDAMLSIGEVTALEFVKAVSSGYNSRGVAWLYGPKVLLIDDLDKAPWNETTLGWLWQLLDRRRDRKHVTIVTSNFEATRLCDMLNARVPKNLSLPTAILDRLRPITNLSFEQGSLRRKESSFAVQLSEHAAESVLAAALEEDECPF